MTVSKEPILREIKRAAAENNGKPLGWRKFADLTGIRYADWYGKHWARWGDAIREAGFSPNEMQQPYESEDLLEKIAVFAKEIGRWPAEGDLILRKRTDKEFPNNRTIARTFGSKPQLATALIDYIGDRAGFDVVVRACQAVALDEDRAVEDDEPAGSEQFGFVYMLRSGRNYKIGRTNSVGRRERELSIQLPEKVSLVHEIRTDDPMGIEKYWHSRFQDKRKNGEWFELSSADVAAFKRRKFM